MNRYIEDIEGRFIKIGHITCFCVIEELVEFDPVRNIYYVAAQVKDSRQWKRYRLNNFTNSRKESEDYLREMMLILDPDQDD